MMSPRGVALVLMLALGSCTSTPAHRDVAAPVRPDGLIPEDFQFPKPAVTGPRPTDIYKVVVGADDRTLTITYSDGVKECFGLHHTEASYGKREVGLTVLVGDLPFEGICNLPALTWRTSVRLSEPIGARRIIDERSGKILF